MSSAQEGETSGATWTIECPKMFMQLLPTSTTDSAFSHCLCNLLPCNLLYSSLLCPSYCCTLQLVFYNFTFDLPFIGNIWPKFEVVAAMVAHHVMLSAQTLLVAREEDGFTGFGSCYMVDLEVDTAHPVCWDLDFDRSVGKEELPNFELLPVGFGDGFCRRDGFGKSEGEESWMLDLHCSSAPNFGVEDEVVVDEDGEGTARDGEEDLATAVTAAAG
ncbi:hypothetical protein ACLOJK_020296 [Asimina triloba]